MNTAWANAGVTVCWIESRGSVAITRKTKTPAKIVLIMSGPPRTRKEFLDEVIAELILARRNLPISGHIKQVQPKHFSSVRAVVDLPYCCGVVCLRSTTMNPWGN